MIAAIYARKSTEQNGVNEEEKSVTRQVEHAKGLRTRRAGPFPTIVSISMMVCAA